MEKVIKLMSADGVEYELPIEVARVSDLLAGLLENLEEEILELPMVKSNALEKVLQWCAHHHDDGSSDSSSDSPANSEDEAEGNGENGEMKGKRRKKIDSWDIRFLDEQEPATLFDMLVAARDLGVQTLLDMTCKLVYGLMKNQTPEEVRQNCGVACSDVELMEIEKIIKDNE